MKFAEINWIESPELAKSRCGGVSAVPTDAAYPMFTTAGSEISHTGHRKALLSTSGPFEAIHMSHIGDPQSGHVGRSGDVA